MTRHLTIAALALALLACSGTPEPTAIVTPETPETPIAAAPTAPTAPVVAPPIAPAVPMPVPPDQTFSVLTLPDEIALETLRTRGVDRQIEGDEYVYGEVFMHWETAAHPDPAARDAIAAWAAAGVSDALEEGTPIVSAICHLRLAHERAVAMLCMQTRFGDRGDDSMEVRASMARIENGVLVPFEMSDALVPKPGLRQIFAERCERRYARRVEDGAEEYYNPCTEGAPTLVPARDGVHAVYSSGSSEEPVEVRLAWADLRDSIRADGPLASFVPSTGTHEVTIAGSEQLEARLAIDCHHAFALSAWRPLAEVARLAARARAGGDDVRVQAQSATGETWRVVMVGCLRTTAEAEAMAGRAAAIASTLGERAESLGTIWSEDFAWMRVERSIALRDHRGRGGTWLATLPEGALVPTLIGAFGGEGSRVGYQGTWARVFPGAREGWAAGRYLRAALRQPPDPASMLGGVPEAQRAEAVRDALLGDLAPPGAPAPLWFVAASTTEPAVYVGVAAGTAEGGPPSAPPALARAAGALDELLFVREPIDAPQAYALVGTRVAGAAPGIVHWQLFAPGATVAGWTLDAPTAASVADGERATVTTLVTAEHHRWLVQVQMPDRSTVRVRMDGERMVEERAER